MSNLVDPIQFKGLQGAQLRLVNAGADREPALIAIFECLDWISSIHEYWRGDRKLEEWLVSLDETEKSVALAYRFPRNAVHHNWTQALSEEFEDGATFPIQFPTSWGEWTWSSDLENPRNETGRTRYYELFAGRPARTTILETLKGMSNSDHSDN